MEKRIFVAVEGSHSAVSNFVDEKTLEDVEVSQPRLTDSTADILHFQVGASEIQQAAEAVILSCKTIAALLTGLKA